MFRGISDSSVFPAFPFLDERMKTIHLYIFREIFKTFIFALIVFTGILVLVIVAREAISRGVPLSIALRLFPYTIPEQLRITIPVVLLLATTTFFARMAGSNEFTALKSLGISPWQVIWPVIVFSFFASIGYIWFSEVAVPWGQQNAARILFAGAEEILYSKLRTDHRWSGSGFEITVKGVENKRLISPTITNKDYKATAQWAEIKVDLENERCVIVIHNSIVTDTSQEGTTSIEFVQHEESISLDRIIPTETSSSSPSKMPLKKIPGEIDRCEQEQKLVQNRVAARAAFAACSGDFEEFSLPVWQQNANSLNSIQDTLYRLYLEPQRRLAAGFSCLAFVWIGTMLAIRSKKTDIFASFFACFIPILILYYPLLMLGVEWGKSGTAPPIFIWSGNIFITIIGCRFYKTIRRY